MHATFVAGRPGHQAQGQRQGPAGDRHRTDALVPDGHPGPAERPRARSSTTSSRTPSDLHEVTILDISDYHGQLIPLAEAADNLAARRQPSFDIGGSAFLKPWFDTYRPRRRSGGQERRRHHDGRRRLRRRDAADLELLRRHADDRDHEHDGHRHRRARQPQLRPRRRLPAERRSSRWRTTRSSRRTSSTPTGKTPAEWSPSHVFKFAGRHQGRRSSASRTTTSRRSPSPARSTRSTSRTRPTRSTPRRRSSTKTVDAIVAIGHLGATAGTLTDPTGPLVDLADNVSNVDVVDRRPHRPAGADDARRTACS